MTITVVSPHRDDAAFSLGLAIDTWLKAGHAVQVVNCFTRSDYAPFMDREFLHSNDRMARISALRAKEDLAWVKLCGRQLTLLDLNLKDAPLRLRCAVDEVCDLPLPAPEGVPDKATIRIAKALAESDVLVLPLALGSHVDHRVARNAGLSRAAAPIACAFYEDLPYAARPGLRETAEDTACTLDLGLLPAFAEAEADGAQAIARKRRIALCYDSQIDGAVTEELARFCLQYGGRERLWGNPQWCASALTLAPSESLQVAR